MHQHPLFTSRWIKRKRSQIIGRPLTQSAAEVASLLTRVRVTISSTSKTNKMMTMAKIKRTRWMKVSCRWRTYPST